MQNVLGADFFNHILFGNFESNEIVNQPVNSSFQRHQASSSRANINNNNNRVPAQPSAWVFGYGSLCWYPGFEYVKCVTGYIRGYSRKFWQGNSTHRGTPEKPGRVATLVEEKEGITWGCAYKIVGDTALDYLKQRECTLGGYVTIDTKFFPRIANIDVEGITGEAFPVVLYIATDQSSHWAGEESAQRIAEQIVDSRGPSGHNAEYLLRLAAFMHDEIPDVHDEHLFELERLVLQLMAKRKIPLSSVMGVTPQRIRRDSHGEIRRPPTFEFASRVPVQRLRCLNI